MKKYFTEEERKEADRLKSKRYRESHKEKISLQKKEYAKRNPDILKARKKTHYENNAIKYRQMAYAYAKKRYANDPLYRLRKVLRSRLNTAFQRLKMGKPNQTEILLGADFATVAKHIESKFTEGMSWDKVGVEIHIDHIVPIAAATDTNSLLRLFHYTNLQPLWAEDNLKKGSKIINK